MVRGGFLSGYPISRKKSRIQKKSRWPENRKNPQFFLIFWDFGDFPLGIFPGFSNPDPDPRDIGILLLRFSWNFFVVFISRSRFPRISRFSGFFTRNFFGIFQFRSRSPRCRDFRDFALGIFSGFFEVFISRSRFPRISRFSGFFTRDFSGIFHSGFFRDFSGISGFLGFSDRVFLIVFFSY